MKTENESTVCETPTLYQRIQHEVEELTAKVAKLKHAAEVAQALETMFPEMRFRLTPSLGTTSVIVQIGGLLDLKDATPVLTHIVQSGFHPVYNYDSPEYRRRCYVYADGSGADITVFADLASEGAACEFKQVGVKEQPIYELVCSNGGAN